MSHIEVCIVDALAGRAMTEDGLRQVACDAGATEHDASHAIAVLLLDYVVELDRGNNEYRLSGVRLDKGRTLTSSVSHLLYRRWETLASVSYTFSIPLWLAEAVVMCLKKKGVCVISKDTMHTDNDHWTCTRLPKEIQ